MDWLDLFAVQGILKSLLQHHNSKALILQCSAFFIVQLSHPYLTTGKTIPLTIRTFVGKVMSFAKRVWRLGGLWWNYGQKISWASYGITTVQMQYLFMKVKLICLLTHGSRHDTWQQEPQPWSWHLTTGQSQAKPSWTPRRLTLISLQWSCK